MSEQLAASGSQHLRQLLPAPAREPLPPNPKHHSTRSHVATACDACRKQKSKCSGDRPACHRCVKRRVPCHYTAEPGERASQTLKRNYDALQDRVHAQEGVLELLKNLPTQEAQHILKKLRSGTDITTILSQVKTGNLLLQLAVSPETRFRYQFPYRSQMPEDDVPNNPYLDSMIYDAASLYSPDQYSNSLGPGSSRFAGNLRPTQYQSLYQKPFHAAHVVDTRLSDARPSLWTAVCDDDILMRDILSVFFRCEYSFTSAFQKDLFLEDMATQKQDFCSALLVNIVLAYSCVCWPRFSKRPEYWNPNTLLYRFLAEAKRIWELEVHEPCITTIQAGILFNVFHNLCGLDEIGQAYRVHAITLAHKLHLFDGPILGKNDRIQRGKAYTAWALYSWETLVGFSFMFPPLLRKPPDEALPDPAEDPQWYGEIWLRYPLSESLSPAYFGHVFRTRCHFRIIMNEFCHTAWSKHSSVTLEKANDLFRQLRNRYETLPEPLQAKTIVLPAHLQLHMYYQNLILSIYGPFVNTKSNQTPSPAQIVADAGRYLQTLVRLYYLRHGFNSMDLFIVIPLILTGFKCINDIDEQPPAYKIESLRSTLILVATGLYSQRRNHYLAEALFRVIRGRMRPHEAALLRRILNIGPCDTEQEQTPMQTVRSHWPVSIVKKEDVDSNILTNLVESYAHMNVEGESATAQDIEPAQRTSTD